MVPCKLVSRMPIKYSNASFSDTCKTRQATFMVSDLCLFRLRFPSASAQPLWVSSIFFPWSLTMSNNHNVNMKIKFELFFRKTMREATTPMIILTLLHHGIIPQLREELFSIHSIRPTWWHHWTPIEGDGSTHTLVGHRVKRLFFIIRVRIIWGSYRLWVVTLKVPMMKRWLQRATIHSVALPSVWKNISWKKEAEGWYNIHMISWWVLKFDARHNKYR